MTNNLKEFMKKAGFPSKLSANAFLEAINSFLGKEKFEEIIREM